MDPIEAINGARATRLVDENGDEVALEFAPGLSATEIELLQTEIGVPLPGDLRALLEHTTGIEGGVLETIDFTGRDLAFEERSLFPADSPSRTTASGTSGSST